MKEETIVITDPMTLVELSAADCATLRSSPERALHAVAHVRSQLQAVELAMKSTAIDRERQPRPDVGKLSSDESDRLLLKLPSICSFALPGESGMMRSHASRSVRGASAPR